MKPGIIALLTDFGLFDNYIGVVKGVIAGISPEAQVIDLCHSVESFSIVNAQYHMYASCRYFPRGTVFYVVIDPGVGSNRKGLVVQAGDFQFVLPDNGLISAIETNFEIDGVYEIDMARFSDVSATFHGRDIFAKVAAELANGETPDTLGQKLDTYMQKAFPHYMIRGKETGSEIVHIDIFGNVITAVPNEILELGAGCHISFNHETRKHIFQCCRTYSDLPRAEYGILYGSSGLIELAMNQGSLADEMQLEVGDRVIIHNE